MRGAAGIHGADLHGQQFTDGPFVQPFQVAQHEHRAMLRREPVQHVPDVGGQLRIARGGQLGELDVRVSGRARGDPHGFADRDHAHPAVERGRLTQGPQAAEDHGQRLLDGVRAVLQGDRPAQSADVGCEPVEQGVHRPGVTALRSPHEGDVIVGHGVLSFDQVARPAVKNLRASSATSSGYCSGSRWPPPGTMRWVRSSA